MAPTRERGGHCRIEQFVHLFRVKCQLGNVVVHDWLLFGQQPKIQYEHTQTEGGEKERGEREGERERSAHYDNFQLHIETNIFTFYTKKVEKNRQ